MGLWKKLRFLQKQCRYKYIQDRFYHSVFTKSRMGYTCSGDPSRFAKIADLPSRLSIPFPELLHFTLLIFSVNLVCVEKNCVMFFWIHGKTQKSPLSLSSLLDVLLFLFCLWNVTAQPYISLYSSFLDFETQHVPTE